MGFYIDLNPIGPSGQEYRETSIPPSFWALYTIAGFALLCMGLAAHSLLKELLRSGSAFDITLVALIFLAVPFYFLVGFKLGSIRKFVSFSGAELRSGFLVGKIPLIQKVITRENVKEILLMNQKPSPNVARVQHDDAQYMIRGHWRVIAVLANKKQVVLDRHTEKGALEPLYQNLLRWME